MESFLYKLLVVGDTGVGKTSLIRRYCDMVYTGNYKATVGVEFNSKTLKSDNKEIQAQLWDIGGREMIGNMTRVYYKGAVGAVVVCAVGTPSSLSNAAKWKADIDQKVELLDSSKIPCLLIANKCDLGETFVSPTIEEFAAQHGFIGYAEVSAKEGTNVDTAFLSLIETISSMSERPAQDPNAFKVVMEDRKRPRDTNDEGLSSVVLNDCDPARSWRCEKAVLVGQTPQVYVFMHPLKVSYMHFVIVPRERHPATSRSGCVKLLENAAKDVIKRYTKAADCRKFLFKHKGKFRQDSRVSSTSRWTGPKEIEELIKHWGANTDVTYTYGFEAFDPVIHDMHLHIMSQDFIYLTDAADWSLLTTDWGLMSPASLATILQNDVAVTFPGPEEMNEKLIAAELKCFKTGKVFGTLDEVRQCSFQALTGRAAQVAKPKEKVSTPFSESEDEGEEDVGPMQSVSEQRESSVATVATRELPAPTGAASLLAKPKKPNPKVKDISESIIAAFHKWCEYLFHLKYLNTDEGEQNHATSQMQQLAARKCLKHHDIINMNEIQVRIRNKFFGEPEAEKSKRKARWDGYEVNVTEKEVNAEIDSDRVPF